VGEVNLDEGEDASVQFSEAPELAQGAGGFFRRIGLLWRMLRDKGYRTGPLFRGMLLLLPLWLISPLDPIPDFIFGIGLLDDLLAVFFTLGVIGREIDRYSANYGANSEAEGS